MHSWNHRAVHTVTCQLHIREQTAKGVTGLAAENNIRIKPLLPDLLPEAGPMVLIEDIPLSENNTGIEPVLPFSIWSHGPK